MSSSKLRFKLIGPSTHEVRLNGRFIGIVEKGPSGLWSGRHTPESPVSKVAFVRLDVAWALVNS